MDDIVKQAALAEFDETLGLLNVLTVTEHDRISTQFRMKILQARHQDAFIQKVQLLTNKWNTRKRTTVQRAENARQQLIHVLQLDWFNQPAEVQAVRAKLHLRRLVAERNFPQELDGRDVARLTAALA